MSHHLLRSVASVVSVMAAGLASSATATAVDFPLVRTQEATIARIHAAMEAGELSCRELVQMYLDRIEVYDRRGPALRAIVRVNPNAMARAEALDAVFSRGERAGPLHCIPMIVKDNYDTADMPTTAGSRSLETSVPPDDAYQVLKIREAGAIVLAKSNMAEFAFSAYETLSSMVPGHTLNPYALDRVPAGSSGGTAAAVAASFGAVGLGTDTGNSIRGPSSHASLVGIRSTMGLTSRDGIVPLNLSRDIGGPIARTVRDAVLVFDVLAGHDPADESTAPARDRAEADYARYLVRDGLQGARVGVLRQLIQDTADPDVISLFDQALADMREQGAVIVDPVDIPGFDPEPPRISGCNYFKFDLNAYLAGLGPGAPVTSLDGIIESRKFHPSIEKRLLDAQAIELAVERSGQYGSCTLSIRRSHHIACLAVFLERATAQGRMVILASSDPANSGVAPYGGRRQLYTPNPIAIGIPTDDAPVLIDISASITTLGLCTRLNAEGRRLEHP